MKWQGDKDRILIKDLKSIIDSSATIRGRVTEIRDLGGISFIIVVDRSGLCQLVIDSRQKLPVLQSIVACTGRITANEKAPTGIEMYVEDLEVVSSPEKELPFNPARLNTPIRSDGPNIETLFNYRGLSLRSATHQSIVKLTSELLRAIDDFFRSRDFVEIKTSKIVGGGTEGGSGLFEVKYFERVAYLAQSPQLYKQTLAATPLERVFEIGPAFRAEKHATIRHINEFTSIDVEMAFPQGMDELMDIQEDLIKHCIAHLSSTCQDTIGILETELPKIDGDIPRLDLDQAKEIVTGVKPTRSKPAQDLTPEEEHKICQWALQHHNSEAVFVHSFPVSKRPFYTMRQENPRKTQSFDLILRGLEISSGSIRVHDPKLLKANLEKQGLNIESLSSYLEVFQFACPPHGGFGIGLERLLQKLLNLPNIRYACLFPRDRNRIEP
jgi:nondiscriminating aspartyl-tRNA synthetase